jgi:RNA polymerase sigma-70 factor, ECF subfamily
VQSTYFLQSTRKSFPSCIFCILFGKDLRIGECRQISERGEDRVNRPFPLSSESHGKVREREFRAIVEAHQSRVYSIAFRILNDVGLAEEVAQDVFLALYRDLGRIESDEHVTAWLRRVAVHRALDAHRRRASRADYGAEEFQEERAVLPINHDGAALVSQHSGPANVRQLVASLPAVQKSVVLLRYQEDMLPAEISEALSMPLATVKSHLQRALKLLRAKAERQGKEVAHG